MRKTFADQFFGVTWDVGLPFYIWMGEERFAVKAKKNGNVFVGPLK